MYSFANSIFNEYSRPYFQLHIVSTTFTSDPLEVTMGNYDKFRWGIIWVYLRPYFQVQQECMHCKRICSRGPHNIIDIFQGHGTNPQGWGADHTNHFWHHLSASPSVIINVKNGVPTSIPQHNPTTKNNVTVETGRKLWCDGLINDVNMRSTWSWISSPYPNQIQTHLQHVQIHSPSIIVIRSV